MNFDEQESPGFSFYEAMIKIIQPCLTLLTTFTFGHPIHPLEPNTPQYSEYLLLGNQKRLRIIHVKPTNTNNIPTIATACRENKKIVTSSFSYEEYWFTRSNKPLKLHNCGYSYLQAQGVPSFKISATRVKKIESFVEHLIQETLFEAFQEFFKKIIVKSKTNINEGKINFGFVAGEDPFCNVLFCKSLKNKLTNCSHISTTSKKKPVILLLHGIGDCADIWWNIINTFIYNSYEVVAPDMLGHGYSSIPNNANDYKFQSILQYTLTVFDHYVGCDDSKTCIIVAHSYGCSLATALCQHRSQQIIQLILISGGGPTPLAPPANENGISNIHCLHSLIKPLLFCGIQRTILYPLRGKHFGACNQNNGVPSYILEYITNGQNWPEGDASFHRRILIPTLLVHGLQDNKITLVQECEMERTIPRAFLELIPNAGHMCMLETPEHLSHMIMCFIEWWSNGNF